MQVSGHRSD